MGDQRVPQLSLDERPEPLQVADGDRIVQPEALLEALEVLGGQGRIVLVDGERTSRQQLQYEEDRHRDQKQQRQRFEDAAEEIACHDEWVVSRGQWVADSRQSRLGQQADDPRPLPTTHYALLTIC